MGLASPFAFFPDGKRILAEIAGGSDGSNCQIKMLDAADGSEVRAFDLDNPNLQCLAVAPDGKSFLRTGGRSPDLKLVDVKTGQTVQSLRGGSSTDAFAFSAEGRRVLSAANQGGGVGCLWDLGTGKVLRSFPCSDHWRWPIAFSPDGRLAVLAQDHADGSPDALVVIAADDGRDLHRLPDDGSEVVAFRADGKRLLSAGGHELKLREVDGGKEVWSVRMESGSRGRVLSADARYALGATGAANSWQGSDIVLTIWDGTTGKVFRTIDGGGTE